MHNTKPENLKIKNPDIWDYCFECGTPLSEDMQENKDWFDIRNCGESFPVCKECHDKADRGELNNSKDEFNTNIEKFKLNNCNAVKTMQGDWTKASHYFEEFHLNTNGAKYASSNGVAIYGYDRDKPFGDRALFNFEFFDEEVWIEVELSKQKAAELDRTIEGLNRVERELREKENAICVEVAKLVDEDIEKAYWKIGKQKNRNTDTL
jgi:hypothetical protein